MSLSVVEVPLGPLIATDVTSYGPMAPTHVALVLQHWSTFGESTPDIVLQQQSAPIADRYFVGSPCLIILMMFLIIVFS